MSQRVCQHGVDRAAERQTAAASLRAALSVARVQARCRLETPPQCLDGHDLSPLLADPDTKWLHPAITTYGEGRFSRRSGPWRYIRYPDGEEELYDHRKDPHELNNLAKDPATESLRAEFRKAVPAKWTPSLGGRNG